MSLAERIAEFSDEHLLTQYLSHKDEYTEQALEIMQQELHRRGYSDDTLAEKAAACTDEQPDSESVALVALDHTFSNTDVLLARSVLAEHNIHFLIQSTGFESSALPVQDQASQEYLIQVPEPDLARAKSALEEVFDPVDGRYQQRVSSICEKLQSLNFSDLTIDVHQEDQDIEVTFSPEETRYILEYARTVLDEAEAIEHRLERPIFFYDHVDEVRQRLSGSTTASLAVVHILTLLELFQIFCSDPDFPPALQESAGHLLAFLGIE
jgi:hypothetical protein